MKREVHCPRCGHWDNIKEWLLVKDPENPSIYCRVVCPTCLRDIGRFLDLIEVREVTENASQES